MKRNVKRLLAGSMAFVLAVTAFIGSPISASAAGAETTDSYVLSYDGEFKPYLYGSRYSYDHSYNDPDAGAGSVWSYNNAPEIFNLINTYEGANTSIAAYCTDADTSTESNTNYRRINLEDSEYHASGAAARLRAVVLNTFPAKTVEEVAAAANAAGYAVTDLAQGELISATQQAIWEITHAEKYTVDSHYDGIRGMSSYDESDFVYPESLDAKETAYTSTNMENLYQYFLSMEGKAPMADAVSEYTFENVVYDSVENDGGTYTVTVSYNINTTVNDGDELTVSAACGDVVQVKELAVGEGRFVFEGLTELKEVRLEINGYQTGGDVYLFDAIGERATSQSMVGYDDSRLPVHGEAVASPDRMIKITKTTSADDGSIPLANIEFEIYRVATMGEIESGDVILSEIPTDEEIEKYQTADNRIAVLTTDAAGFASYNFTENGYPDGVYMIVEKFSSATTGPVDPFFVVVPGTTEEGDGFIYTIDINPKNVTESGPDIKKDVTEIENDWDTFDVNEIHTWIIRGGVPAGIADAVEYVFTDTLDYRLSFKGNIKVKVAHNDDMADEEDVILEDVTDYEVKASETTDAEGNAVDRFTVSLTAAGMDKVAETVADGTGDVADYEVRVYFDAVIDTDADLGVEIPNRAHLDYTNSAGVDYDVDSDIPEVVTGGTNILKLTSGDETPLAGAEFKIAREATEEELADESVVKETLNVGGEKKTVIFAEFYPTADLSGDKVIEAASGEDGKVVIYGLAFGTYYIVETKAPAGYNRLAAPVEVVIDEDSHTVAETVTVLNSRFVLPETGGTGTTIFAVIGAVSVVAAITLIVISEKKRRA